MNDEASEATSTSDPKELRITPLKERTLALGFLSLRLSPGSRCEKVADRVPFPVPWTDTPTHDCPSQRLPPGSRSGTVADASPVLERYATKQVNYDVLTNALRGMRFPFEIFGKRG